MAFIRKTGATDVSQIDHNKINKWIADSLSPKIGNKSPNTVITERGYVLAWLRWSHEMGYKVKVKFPMVACPAPEPTRRKHYTREQIKQVLDSTDDLMVRSIIMIGFDTGLRSGEIYNIRLGDIKGKTISVVGKGRKLAFVRITDETKSELDEWIKCSGANDYLWIRCTRRHYYRRVNRETVVNRVKTAFFDAGFPNFQMHELRHSFATDLRRRGAPLDVVQRLMRHANLQVTQRYLHNLDGDLDKVWDYFRATDFNTQEAEPVEKIMAFMS